MPGERTGERIGAFDSNRSAASGRLFAGIEGAPPVRLSTIAHLLLVPIVY